MGRLRDPALFSKQFEIGTKRLSEMGLFDPILNCDTRLFVDPVLLRGSEHNFIKTKGTQSFNEYFGNIIRVLGKSTSQGDLLWRNASRALNLEERPELCLGYGGSSTRGRNVAAEIKTKVIATAWEIIKLGIEDAELFSLLGLLEDGVGPDTIGDMTTNAILPAIMALTEETARTLELKTKRQAIGEKTASLPVNPFSGRPILLVPLDVLRDLPVASDWSDVSSVAAENDEIRQRVNKYIGNIWKLSLREQKSAIRSQALTSKEAFKTVMDTVYLLDQDHYDYVGDTEGHRIFREGVANLAQAFPLKLRKPRKGNHAELKALIQEIIIHFRTLIEDKGLSYLLWHNAKPRKERAAQKLFFGISDAYCKSNNVDDLSPFFHPTMSRALVSFEPVWLGDATGRGAEPPGSSSAPARCVRGALSLA